MSQILRSEYASNFDIIHFHQQMSCDCAGCLAIKMQIKHYSSNPLDGFATITFAYLMCNSSLSRPRKHCAYESVYSLSMN